MGSCRVSAIPHQNFTTQQKLHPGAVSQSQAGALEQREGETRPGSYFVLWGSYSLGWAGLGWLGLGRAQSWHIVVTIISLQHSCPRVHCRPEYQWGTGSLWSLKSSRLEDTFMVTAEQLSYFQFSFSIIILCLWGLILVVDSIRSSKSTQPLSRHLLVIGDLHLSFAFCIVIHSQSSKSRIQWNPSCISAFSVGWQMMRLYLWFYYRYIY